MNDKYKLSKWEEAIEYGDHLFGVFSRGGKQKLTGVLHHDGNIFESYVETDQWGKFPEWVQEYQETPIGNALEAFINGKQMIVEESSVDNFDHPELELQSAGMGNWRFEYEKKRRFRSAILRGEIDLQTTAIINQYGEVFCPQIDAEQIRSKYWDYVDENYEHRQSYQRNTA